MNSPVRLLKTADGRIVLDSDPDGIWLYRPKGGKVSAAALSKVKGLDYTPERKEATLETKVAKGVKKKKVRGIMSRPRSGRV